MSVDDYDKKKKSSLIDHDEEDTGGGQTGTGTGGQSGQIAFKDFLATGAAVRDDLLPFEELKRLLSTHKDLNELKVKQQKEKRDQYQDLKNGKVQLQTFREGLRGENSQYKANPILANKAQFSGVDRKVSTLPTEHVADTNDEPRNELQNELKHRLSNQYTPAFNPKPRGPY